MSTGVATEHDTGSAFRNSEESGQDRQFGKVSSGKVSVEPRGGGEGLKPGLLELGVREETFLDNLKCTM